MGPDGKEEGKKTIEEMEKRGNGRNWVFNYAGGLLVELAAKLIVTGLPFLGSILLYCRY